MPCACYAAVAAIHPSTSRHQYEATRDRAYVSGMIQGWQFRTSSLHGLEPSFGQRPNYERSATWCDTALVSSFVSCFLHYSGADSVIHRVCSYAHASRTHNYLKICATGIGGRGFRTLRYLVCKAFTGRELASVKWRDQVTA